MIKIIINSNDFIPSKRLGKKRYSFPEARDLLGANLGARLVSNWPQQLPSHRRRADELWLKGLGAPAPTGITFHTKQRLCPQLIAGVWSQY